MTASDLDLEVGEGRDEAWLSSCKELCCEQNWLSNLGGSRSEVVGNRVLKDTFKEKRRSLVTEY